MANAMPTTKLTSGLKSNRVPLGTNGEKISNVASIPEPVVMVTMTLQSLVQCTGRYREPWGTHDPISQTTTGSSTFVDRHKNLSNLFAFARLSQTIKQRG